MKNLPNRLGTLLLSVLCVVRPADAYVQFRAQTGQPFHWTVPCVEIRVYTDDLPEMPPDQIMRAAQGAAAAWSAGTNACSFMNIVVERATGAGPGASFDGVNTISIRRTSWCAVTDSPWTCSYDPTTTSITTVFSRSSTGQIVEADIEVNAKNFQWADVELTGDQASMDLQSALTHEMGHVLGFDHTCVSPGTADPPLDDMGIPTPSCDTASTAVRETTMSAIFVAGDTTKRTLAADDQRAVCETYPRADGGASGDPANPPSFAACAALSDAGTNDGGATDAGTNDGGATDAGGADATKHEDAPGRADTAGEAGPPSPASDGCGCTVSQSGPGGSLLVLAVVGMLVRHRRRRRK